MLKDVFQPGLYYINPYEYRVERGRSRHQPGVVSQGVAPARPSEDAFEIELEATVEWELLPEHVAQVMAEFGLKEAIEEKVIVPQSRSIGRIEGSKHGAKEFLLDRRVSNFKTTSKQSSSGLASRKTSTCCRRLFGTLLSRISSGAD